MALQLCASCARHVRDSESRCPFCDGALAFAKASAVALPRLSRAAQMAFVAAIAIGCEETKPPNDPTTTTSTEDAAVPPVTTIAPPAETTTTPPPPPPNLKKPYGAPPADGLFT